MYTNNIQVLDYHVCLPTYKQYFINNTGWEGDDLLLVKIRGDSYSFDIAESIWQLAPPPTKVTGEGIKLKNYVCNKEAIYWFLLTPYSIK
jgi:hypothetical protein